ncbi:MAG: hypothetical protein RRY64_02435 [Oscillospiraceae bacterium]
MHDKKRLWHTVSGVVALVLVAVFLIGGGCALGEIRGLRREVGRLKNDLNNQISNLDSNLGRQIGDINRRMDEGNSLFSDVKTAMDYRDGQMRFTVSATPKTLTEGDTLTLVLGDSSAPMESKDGSVFSGSVPFPLAEEIAPVLVLTSGGIRRQEALDTLYPKSLLSLQCRSDWENHKEGTLQVYIDSSDNFTVSDLMGGDFALEVKDEGGKTVSTLPLHLKNDNVSVYATADLSKVSVVPGSYQIYLTGKLGGLSYDYTSPLASFDSDATNGNTGIMSGDNLLEPIFK